MTKQKERVITLQKVDLTVNNCIHNNAISMLGGGVVVVNNYTKALVIQL